MDRYKAAMANVDSAADAKLPASAVPISKPVLLVAGELDEVGRPELATAAASDGRKTGVLPNVDVKIIPGAFHWMQVQKPQETFTLLDGFAKGS